MIPSRIWMSTDEDGFLTRDWYDRAPDDDIANFPEVKAEVQYVRADLYDRMQDQAIMALNLIDIRPDLAKRVLREMVE